jgi:chemotaxis signal transduction protein
MDVNAIAVQIDGIWLALDASEVEEVLGERPWTPLHGGTVVGAMPWRGGAIAVVDIAALMGGASRPRRRNPILRKQDATFALPVDQVREPVEAAPMSAEVGPWARGVVEIEGVKMALLDAAALIAAMLR